MAAYLNLTSSIDTSPKLKFFVPLINSMPLDLLNLDTA